MIGKEQDESTSFSFKNAADVQKHTEKRKTLQDHLHISQCPCSQLLMLLCLMPQNTLVFCSMIFYTVIAEPTLKWRSLSVSVEKNEVKSRKTDELILPNFDPI